MNNRVKIPQKRNMIYNTEESQLLMPEYGRCLQKMVEVIKTLPSKEERTQRAKALLPILERIRPQLKEEGNQKRKSWDLLAILSNFQLDIDYPFEPIKSENLYSKPNPVSYPSFRNSQKHYGNNVMAMIERLKTCTTQEERQAILVVMLNQMKKSFLQWNGGSVEDDKIIQDLCILSKGEIRPEEITFKLMNQKAIFEKKNKNQPQKCQPKKGKKNKK